MDSEYQLYIASKLLGYTLWSYIGLSLTGRKSIPQSIGYGFIRLFIGIGFGIAIFIAYHPDGSQNLLTPYLAIYAPIRWLEWSLLGKIMHPQDRFLVSRDWKQNAWRAGGIIVSFAIDFLSPEGMKGMFCVGRCLC